MEVEQTRDTIVRKLTATDGALLEIMANITSPEMVNCRMEGLVDEILGDDVGVQEWMAFYKASISKDGRGRQDLVTIGTVRDSGWKEGEKE